MAKRMPAMRFGKRSSPSIFDLYDERTLTSPYSNNPVFKKRVPPGYGLVHFLNSKMKPSQGDSQGHLSSTLNENENSQMIHDLEKKFLRAGRLPPIHKRRPFSDVPESSEWFDNSEDGGENNEVQKRFRGLPIIEVHKRFRGLPISNSNEGDVRKENDYSVQIIGSQTSLQELQEPEPK